MPACVWTMVRGCMRCIDGVSKNLVHIKCDTTNRPVATVEQLMAADLSAMSRGDWVPMPGINTAQAPGAAFIPTDAGFYNPGGFGGFGGFGGGLGGGVVVLAPVGTSEAPDGWVQEGDTINTVNNSFQTNEFIFNTVFNDVVVNTTVNKDYSFYHEVVIVPTGSQPNPTTVPSPGDTGALFVAMLLIFAVAMRLVKR